MLNFAVNHKGPKIPYQSFVCCYVDGSPTKLSLKLAYHVTIILQYSKMSKHLSNNIAKRLPNSNYLSDYFTSLSFAHRLLHSSFFCTQITSLFFPLHTDFRFTDNCIFYNCGRKSRKKTIVSIFNLNA